MTPYDIFIWFGQAFRQALIGLNPIQEHHGQKGAEDHQID